MKISNLALLALGATSSAYVIPNGAVDSAVEAREAVSLIPLIRAICTDQYFLVPCSCGLESHGCACSLKACHP